MDLYGGQDPRELPAYGIGEAAHYLRIPPTTLWTWVRGRTYPTARGEQYFKPVIDLVDESRGLLSFVNLIEAHVLGAIRQAGVGFRNIRRGLDYLDQQFPSLHPLADKDFQTDGIDLFFQHLEELVNISHGGQLAMRRVLDQCLGSKVVANALREHGFQSICWKIASPTMLPTRCGCRWWVSAVGSFSRRTTRYAGGQWSAMHCYEAAPALLSSRRETCRVRRWPRQS